MRTVPDASQPDEPRGEQNQPVEFRDDSGPVEFRDEDGPVEFVDEELPVDFRDEERAADVGRDDGFPSRGDRPS